MKKKIIKNTSDLFKFLKINSSIIKKRQKAFFEKNGYIIIKKNKFLKKNINYFRNEIDKHILLEGSKGGWEGKEKYYKKGKFFEPGCNRLGNLIEKNLIFSELIQIKEVLFFAKEVIKGEIKVCGLNYREPLKGVGLQKLHMDWKPREKNNDSYSGIVAMFYFDNTNKDNGSTRIIPKSHKFTGWPENYIDISKKQKNEVSPKMKAGDIIILNLNLWHAGSNNKTGKRRRMIMLNIKERSFPQLLNYKKYLSEKTKKRLNNVKKYLLSIRRHDKKQKENSIGVGKFYKKDFYINNVKQERV